MALAPKQLGVIDKPVGSIRITLLALELQINFRYAARLFDEGGDLGQVPADVGVLHWRVWWGSCNFDKRQTSDNEF